MLKKLIPNLDGKANYVLNYRNLQLYLSLRIKLTKLTKIHKVLKFKQSHWMKTYIDFNIHTHTHTHTHKKKKKKEKKEKENLLIGLEINRLS